MNHELLGQLTQHPQIPQWLESKPVKIPYLDGLEMQFTIEGLATDDAPADFTHAIQNFLALTAVDRDPAAPYAYQNFREMFDIVKESFATPEEAESLIIPESDIWDHVRPTHLYASRRHHHDRKVYITIAAECTWEPEHGLQIIYKEGKNLSRVSSQDGHLTYADSLDLPEDQDRIA